MNSIRYIKDTAAGKLKIQSDMGIGKERYFKWIKRNGKGESL